MCLRLKLLAKLKNKELPKQLPNYDKTGNFYFMAAKLIKNTEKQKDRVYIFLLSVDTATKKEIEAATGVKDNSQGKSLLALKNEGKIKNVGSRKEAVYSAHPDKWEEQEAALAEESKPKKSKENVIPDAVPEVTDATPDEVGMAELMKADEEKQRQKMLAENLPIYGFIGDIQSYITNLTDTLNCNRNFVVLAMLGAAAHCGGKNITVIDGKNIINRLSTFIGIIAPPGSNKSQPVKRVWRYPVEHNKRVLRRYIQDTEMWEAIKDNTEPKPRNNQTIIKDFTPESLVDIQLESKFGLTVFNDELKIMIDNAERYSSKGNGFLTSLIEAWEGNEVIVNRTSKMPKIADEVCLGIIGTIQPKVFAKLFRSKGFVENGFCQRWLFAVQKNRKANKYSEQTPDEHLQEQWDWVLEQILEGKKRVLRIEGEAKSEYAKYYNELDEKIDSCDDEDVVAVYAKLQIIVERVAATIHLISMDKSDVISAETMKFAVDMMAYLERTQMEALELIKSGGKSSEKKMSIQEVLRMVEDRFGMKKRGYTQQEIADLFGVDKGTVSKAFNSSN